MTRSLPLFCVFILLFTPALLHAADGPSVTDMLEYRVPPPTRSPTVLLDFAGGGW